MAQGGNGVTRRVHTPTVLQMEAVECGAAALGIVLGFHGRWVPLEELRVATGVSRDGARAGNLARAARHYGLRAQGIHCDADEALTEPVPYIAFWNANHFLVVEGANRRRVWINDPATGPRQISREAFQEGFGGVLLRMRPGPDFRRGGHRQSLREALLARLRGSRAALTYVVLVVLLLVIPGLLLPAFLNHFIDDVLIARQTTWLLPLLLGLGMSALFGTVLTWLQQRHLLRLQTKLAITSASEFFWHVLRLPIVFYTQRHAGDVALRVDSCHRIAALLAGPLSTTLSNTLTLGFYAGIMVLYSPQLTAITAVVAASSVLALRLSRRRLRDVNSVLLNEQARLTGVSMAGIQAIETVKATGAEQDLFGLWAGHQVRSINNQQRLGILAAGVSAGPGLVEHLSTAAVLGVGGWLIMRGDLTIGGLVAFQSLSGHFVGPVQSLVGFGAQLEQIKGEFNRIDDVLRHPLDPALHEEPRSHDPVTGHFSAGKLSGEIELRDVTFGYDRLGAPLLEGFHLHVRPGQRVALVGGSGSGKTTVARLIAGLYEPWSGTIAFDGIARECIPRDVLTASLEMVSQEISFVEGTIRDNLTLWDQTIPEETVIRAAQDACIHETIASRPDGYRSLLAEGAANFSGGQAQRLEIARGLAREPTMLILDEATAALDPLTEQRIDDALRRRGITCVLIAHRLSTIRDCDEILVLDHGKVVERGSHERLMALNGVYARLVRSQ